LEIVKELAKRRMSMGGSGVKVETNVSTLIGKTTEIVAKTIGVNYKTFERAKKNYPKTIRLIFKA